MRRRRLMGPVGGGQLRRHEGEATWLKAVVATRFPLAAAKSFLGRHMGQTVDVRMVEVQRGEQPGVVRAIEVRHANGGQISMVYGQRQLASGAPASFYVPDHLVTVATEVTGPLGRTGALGVHDVLVLHVPVRGYLRFLPAIFRGDGPVRSSDIFEDDTNALVRLGGSTEVGLPREAVHRVVDGDPLRRYLFIFQTVMATVTDQVDRLVDLTDPLRCDPSFLPWLASWVGFELDGALPVQQQRELVQRAIRLYRTRGTRIGLEEMVRVLTSAPAAVREVDPPSPMVLGRAPLVGGSNLVERFRRGESRGGYLFSPGPQTARRFFTLALEPRGRFASRFGERAGYALNRIVDVVSRERPAHLAFTVEFDETT